MIYILAKTFDQAREYARKHVIGAERITWRFISDAGSMRGIVYPNVCRIGNYWERPDIMSIEEMLAVRQATFIPTTEFKGIPRLTNQKK